MLHWLSCLEMFMCILYTASVGLWILFYMSITEYKKEPLILMFRFVCFFF